MRKKVLTVAVATSVLLAGTLPAFADGHEDGPIHIYDEEQHILMFAVDGECTLDAEVDVEFMVEEDGSITFEVVEEEAAATGSDSAFAAVEDTEGDDPLAGCHPFSVEGPNGQVNHGTFVSNLMHALKEMGIKGSDKKEFKQALKGYGKGDMQVKVNEVDTNGDLDEGETSEELKLKPAKAEKSQKNKSNKGKANGRNK